MTLDVGELCGDFRTRFGTEPVWGASAPGRVNLIGEHIDYNGGWVLPAAINRETTVLAGPSPDGVLRVHSLSFSEPFECDASRIPEGQVTPAWANYFLGAHDQMALRGHPLPPLQVLVAGDVPTAAGLSSSAAFLVSLFTLFESVLGVRIPGREKALWSQAAEHAERLSIRSGIMDQFISANAVPGCALKLNCGTLESTTVPLDPDRLAMVIIHSTVARELVVSAYNQRRLECENALAELNRRSGREEEYLVGYTLEEFESLSDGMDPTQLKRARHVITEQARVDRFEDALRNHRWEETGFHLAESHRSLREDYEVSCPELDVIQEAAEATEGVYGCRMTGAGFGGCAVALTTPDSAERAAVEIASTVEKRIGKTPWTLISPAMGGSHPVEVGEQGNDHPKS